MSSTRRDFLRGATALTAVSVVPTQARGVDDPPPIIDTHQHLWDRSRFRLAWISPKSVLDRNYLPSDYLEAVRGLGVVQAVYMEVDVDPEQHPAEADYVDDLARTKTGLTRAAVVGGRPASPDFAAYVKRLREKRSVKGIRQVLHGSTPAGFCLKPEFVRGIRQLGEAGLSFDLCLRPGELADGRKLTELCPDTRFVLDHCGNADVNAFRKGGSSSPSHDPDAWRRDIDALARRPNLIGKISGIIARAPKGWTADDLAPVVNHCFDAFGPDRVVFGGDWPVCLLGATYRQWVEALRGIVASRPASDQRKLFHDNAERFYRLGTA